MNEDYVIEGMILSGIAVAIVHAYFALTESIAECRCLQ